MLTTFGTLDELLEHLRADKEWTGANAAQHDRYPVRFVLFDNFADFRQFIDERPEGVFQQALDSMLDAADPDQFLSHTELSKAIRRFVKSIPAHDYIICPFSEMARFYDNTERREFDSLVTTVRGLEAPAASLAAHVRVYIPIVGMQGKMSRLIADSQTFVWEYRSGTDKGTYTLVLTDGTTYGVGGLDESYSVVTNLGQWLRLWRKGADVKPTIISSSPNLYASAGNANPDNAFTYRVCCNAWEFLTLGLGLDFGPDAAPRPDEVHYWEELAALIDVRDFDFDQFVKERLDTFTLADGTDFIESWFDCGSDFERWLLTLYFRKISRGEGYINRALERCSSLSTAELFSRIATLIFELDDKDKYIAERLAAMRFAADKDVKITDEARTALADALRRTAAGTDPGACAAAVSLLTPLTDDERRLCIEWVAAGRVAPADIKNVFPGLHSYLAPLSLNTMDDSNRWIDAYFDAYRRSKIADAISPEMRALLTERNADAATCQAWTDSFKTVKTLLHKRDDIDVIYWIDGLGVDWIPFVRDVIGRYAKEHVYLNEIYVAAATLPTTTAANKPRLQSLLPEGTTLPKCGDIDAFAHTAKSYPQYIIDEMRIVEEAICSVLDDYNGKKIAFVSDHGITYLSQLEEGRKLGGMMPDHEGRVATYTGNLVDDDGYIKLDDGRTVCSLIHRSLTDKVSRGHGAHGGATPEEILVPVVIVSSQKNAANYAVKIVSATIDARKPFVSFSIRGLTGSESLTLTYNDVTYSLRRTDGDIYRSEKLNIVDTATKLTLHIGTDYSRSFDIKISTGAEEDDLFDL